MGGSSGMAYSKVVGPANSIASATGGGPWSLVAVAGFSLSSSTLAYPNATLGSGCTYSVPDGGGLPSGLFVPAFSGSFSSGTAPAWLLVYFQSANQSALLVGVTNGSARALVIATGSCTTTFQSFGPVPASVVDSSVAAAAAWQGGGSAFVSQHSGISLNLEMALVGSGNGCSLLGGCWAFVYSPCNPLGGNNPSGAQPYFTSEVYASTGTQLSSFSSTTTCGAASATPLGSALQLGTPSAFVGTGSTSGCAPGDYCAEVPIVSASGNLRPADLDAEVVNSTTSSTVPGVVSFAILNAQGQVEVSAAGNPGGPWSPGVGTAATPLTSSMSFVIDLGHVNPTGAGYLFELIGLGSFGGTVEVGLV